MRTMPSAKQRRPAEPAGNARFDANKRRGARHSSTVGINRKAERRRSRGLPRRRPHSHRRSLHQPDR
ncbi:UNVERIFIED_ORG: hypothetical protein GGD48_005745 [Rhizobium etli]